MGTSAGQEYRPGRGGALTLHPAGTELVYVGPAADGSGSALWRRPLGTLDATRIPNTDGARRPAYSTDGAFLAYSLGEVGEIHVVDANGGAPVILPDAPPRFAWGDDGGIYYVEWQQLRRWMPGEAEPRTVRTIDRDFMGPTHLRAVLPGVGAVILENRDSIHALDVGSGTVTTLGAGTNARVLSTGHLAYLRPDDRALLVRPFDMRSTSWTGPAVATTVVVDRSFADAQFAVSQDGSLVYGPGREAEGEELIWVDRGGGVEPIDWLDPIPTGGLALSPSGDSLAVSWQGGVGETGAEDVWILDLQQQSRFPLTRDGVSIRPAWHPDGQRVSYVGGSEGRGIYLIDADGSGSPELITEVERNGPSDGWWTRDGRELLIRQAGENLRGIFRFVVGESEVAEPWLDRRFFDRNPVPSPEGDWLVYTSDQSGRDEVLAQPYPEGGRVVPVSVDGGGVAVWSRDGTEIYWQGADGFMWAAAVEVSADDFVVSSRERLFSIDELGVPLDLHRPNWDVGPDGRFLFARPVGDDGAAPLVLVRNWVLEVTSER